MTTEPAAGPVFDIRDLHFAYHGVPALDGLSLSLPVGRRIALLGANGSGKSTLLKLLAALYFAERGTISAFGAPLTEHAMQDPDTATAFRRRVGLVFQNPDIQLFSSTVFDELAFGPLQLGWPEPVVRARIAVTLRAFSIEHLKDRAPYRLSGGEKKRVALACVLVMEPEVLLLDEPTAALDPESASAVIDLLVRESGSGRTVITATHDLDIVEAIADCCIVMQAGKVVASGTPQEILGDVPLLVRTHLAHSHLHAHDDHGMHRHHHLHRAAQHSDGGHD